MQVRSVDGSNAARGRVPIAKGLTRDVHVLFRLGCLSRLAGHKGNVVTNTIVSSGVEAFVAKPSMSAQSRLQRFPPGGVRPQGSPAPGS